LRASQAQRMLEQPELLQAPFEQSARLQKATAAVSQHGPVARHAIWRERSSRKKQRLPAAADPALRGEARHSVERFAEQALRFAGGASSASPPQKRRGQERIRPTALTIPREAPMATPQTCSSASLDNRTHGLLSLAFILARKLDSNGYSIG